MKVVGSTIGTLLKRPFIFLFFGIIIFLYLLFDKVNPVFTVIYGLATMGKSDILGSIVALLQFMLQPSIILKGLLLLAAFILGFSLLAGMIFSGLFNVIIGYAEKKSGTEFGFFKGISRYFLKMFLVTFIALIGAFVLLLVLMISSVPAIVVTEAAAGKASFILVAILLDFITVGALFFGLMFFSMYVIFWYPAVFNGNKSFRTGKSIVDSNFWRILGKVFLLNIVFIASEAVFIQPNDSIMFFIANLIFKTVYFSFYSTYIFSLYAFYRDKKQELSLE